MINPKPECYERDQMEDQTMGIDRDQSNPAATPESSEETSSSSSNSFSDELFQIDITSIDKPNMGLDGSSRGSMRLPTYGVLPSKSDSSAMKQSPPIQTMGRPDVPAPEMMTSSFACSSNSMAEWSEASSDSLFSIGFEKTEDNHFVGRPTVLPHLDLSLPKAVVVPHSGSTSTSHLSDGGGSVSSNRSFAFPICTSQARTGSTRDDSLCNVQLPTVKERPRPRSSFQDENGDAQHLEEVKESPKSGPVATRRSCLRWALCCCLPSCCRFPSCCRLPSCCWPSRPSCCWPSRPSCCWPSRPSCCWPARPSCCWPSRPSCC